MRLFLFVFFISLAPLFAQQKFEKEFRIKKSEAPTKALEFIKSVNLKNKLKWYAEESNDGKTYEVKTCFRKYKYSIEFSENGKVLDIEKTIKLKQLEVLTQQKIKQSLSKRFKKYKIKKLQIQYIADENWIYKNLFQTENSHTKAKINYELIVKGKTNKMFSQFEILINQEGEIIKELLFTSSNSLNLEF